MNDFLDLTGASGAAYRFRIWPPGAPHLPMAGNYACVREERDGYSIVLLGESLDLSQVRDKLPKKARETTTHIYTRLNVARAIRCAEHDDLKAHLAAPARQRAPVG
jgi:hypothetical protein